MKKKTTMILLCVLLLVLEILPFGAALHTGIDDTHSVTFYSFFHTAPLHDGNFSPFVIAILSVVLLILSIIDCFIKIDKMEQIIFAVSCITMLLAFCPLLYCIECYGIIPCLIGIVLFIQTMMYVKKAK